MCFDRDVPKCSKEAAAGICYTFSGQLADRFKELFPTDHAQVCIDEPSRLQCLDTSINYSICSERVFGELRQYSNP